MGNAAGVVDPDAFSKLRAEYDAQKEKLSDQELFDHMLKTYNATALAQGTTAVTTTSAEGDLSQQNNAAAATAQVDSADQTTA
jgi:hypothetical protein